MKNFVIEQKITPLANQYRVYEVGEHESALVAFAHQKRFTMKEAVNFYTDESQKAIGFTVAAEKVLDIHGKFFVRDEKGNQIGILRKSFASSLLRSTYELLDTNDSVVVIVQERSIVLAVLRRLWGFIPFLGDIPFLFKYHFDFIDPESKNIVARYNKTKRFRDHYELLIDDKTLITKLGWQTLVAQAVMLDVMQGR